MGVADCARHSQDVQNALSRGSDLMKAIGAGIGNNAAHELAHQFLRQFYGMDDSSAIVTTENQCDGDKAPGSMYRTILGGRHG